MCLLLVLRTNEAADVCPHSLKDDQEGQQVDEQSDSLEKGGGMEKTEVDDRGSAYSREAGRHGRGKIKEKDSVTRNG